MTELQFEPLTLNDLDKIKDLTPNGWGDIAPFHSYYLNSNNSYPLKAMLNEKIVGIGTSIVFEKTCWLAHIIVSDLHRNQGIGSEIVNRLLVEVKNKGIETCSLIATELGKPIYQIWFQRGWRIYIYDSYLCPKKRRCFQKDNFF